MDTRALRGRGIPTRHDSTFMSESESMGKTMRMEIRSDPAELGRVRASVETFAQDVGMDEQGAAKVVLALDEALTNIIRHAYEGANDKPIEIDLRVRDQCLCLVLRDYGKVAERTEIRSRNLDDVRPGGLGVHIMNQCMDVVEYQVAEGGGTRLTMTKTIAGSDNERTNGPNHE